MQDYRKIAFAGFREDDTEEDKEYVLAELIERNVPASAEVVNALLEQRREFKARAKLAAQIDSTKQMEIVEDLERQYPMMKEALERFGFSTQYMPEWVTDSFVINDVRHRLTLNMLIPAQNLIQPTLLLLPPWFSLTMVKAINAHRLPRQKRCSYPGLWALSDFFWDNWDKKRQPHWDPRAWGIAIAEGSPNIPVHVDRVGGNNLKFSEWREKIKAKGLDVMDSACAWLTLWMAKAHQGKFIDDDCPNVLKERPLSQFGNPVDLVAVQWTGNRIKFEHLSDLEAAGGLHARGIVWIVKPQ